MDQDFSYTKQSTALKNPGVQIKSCIKAYGTMYLPHSNVIDIREQKQNNISAAYYDEWRYSSLVLQSNIEMHADLLRRFISSYIKTSFLGPGEYLTILLWTGFAIFLFKALSL